MRRRGFLETGLLALGTLIPGCGGGGGDAVSAADPGAATGLPEQQPLRALPTLANEAVSTAQFTGTLVAAPAQFTLIPGVSTGLWLYNGAAPGPLVDLREGQRVRLRLDNRLPQDTTIHWHGLPVPPDQDGSPMDPVAPGASRVYEFDIPVGSAGTYWYHPHAHRTTAAQVAMGLAAPLIVRAADDPLRDLPEVTMFVTGLRLERDGRVSPDNPMDWTLGRQGELLLVNGGYVPVHTVRPGATQRWRILNATSARYFRLALDGHTFTLVGTDGGLLAVPRAGLTEILVAPAQRVEVVVTLDATPGARHRLRALRYDAGTMGMMGVGMQADQDLLIVATTAEQPLPPVAVPPSLRPIAPPAVAVRRQRVELTEGAGMGMMNGAMMAFSINGRTFDPARIDLVAQAGATEAWDIVNATPMDHPIHVHGTQFQLLSRTVAGITTPAPFAAWLDTINVPSGETATIAVRQSMPGKRMFHCHILEHEDAGMMGVLDVRPA